MKTPAREARKGNQRLRGGEGVLGYSQERQGRPNSSVVTRVTKAPRAEDKDGKRQ